MSDRSANWKEVELGDICEFAYGKSLPEKARTGYGLPVFGSNGQVGLHEHALTDGPTIIIGRKGSFGEVHFSEEACSPIDTTYYISQDQTEAYLPWLARVLGSVGLKSLNRAAAVPGLNRTDAYRQKLLLPPLSEQKRIAEILDAADALRAKRRESLARLDAFLQSTFLHMFGDPVTNPMGWDETCALGDLAEVVSGITKGRKTNGKSLREVPYLAVYNVQDRFLRLDAVKTIAATEEEVARYALMPGDLLLTEGGDPDKLGRGALWKGEVPDCIHQNHVFRVRLSAPDVDPVFLNWIVGSARGKQYFLRSAKQTTGIASINMKQLRAFPMIVPPRELQTRFASIVQSVEGQKSRLGEYLTELDTLFASLQARAFNGEL